MPDQPTRRGAGRPRRTEAEIEQVRERIIAATAAEFAKVGYHKLTITKVIEQADVSRTNFYHYYRHIDEPLAIVMARLVDALVEMIDERVAGAPYTGERVLAGINAYLEWSVRNREYMGAVFAGLHDPDSPVYRIRQDGVEAVTAIVMRDYERIAAGQARPTSSTIDLFVNTLEYSCYRLHLDTEATPGDVDATRGLMLKVATGLLGSPTDLRNLADWLEQH